MLPDKEALEATSQLLDTIYHGYATRITNPGHELRDKIFSMAYHLSNQLMQIFLMMMLID